jgi:septal ring factor EnvC (AmiA/AmiB activator)
MSGFLCCWMWLLVGLLLGWLAHWLFDKLFGRDGDEAGARWKREYDAVNAKLSSLQTDLNAANSKAGKIQGEFDASKAKVSGLENDLNAHLASLKAKNEELNKLGAENADLRARLGPRALLQLRPLQPPLPQQPSQRLVDLDLCRKKMAKMT